MLTRVDQSAPNRRWDGGHTGDRPCPEMLISATVAESKQYGAFNGWELPELTVSS